MPTGMRDSFIQFSIGTMEEILEASYVYPNGKGDLPEYIMIGCNSG